MFRIKICGVTSPKDAQLAALAGADAIGLNFYSGSSRYIDPSVAQKIAAAVPSHVARVGLFVNSNSAEILDISNQVKLDWIQLHGDEPVELLGQLAGRSVLRAFRFGSDGVAPIAQYLADCQRLQMHPTAILIDAATPGEYGGTGKSVDWSALANVRDQLGSYPLVLAGGLTPFNVIEAITTVRPDAVDVASGVESKAGSKDLLLVRAFINAAKKAFSDAEAGKQS